MSAGMKRPSLLYLGFVAVLVLGLILPAARAFGAASLSVNNNVETVGNQAMTGNQELVIFSGSITNSGDSGATLNSVSFEFNPNRILDDPEDNIDTLIVQINGSVHERIDVDSGPTGPTYVSSGIGAGIPANNSGQVTYEFRLHSLDDPVHDDEFTLQFNGYSATESTSGKPLGDNDIVTSNIITIKNLIIPYDNIDDRFSGITNEDIPRVLASESDRIPLIYMEFGGQNSSDNPVRGFHELKFRIRELIGDVIPGGFSTNDSHGDFSEIALIRSDQKLFGEGSQEVLFTISRTQLPDNPADSYVIDFADDTDDEDGDGIWPPDTSNENELFSETTDNVSYYVTIKTNVGWGTAPLEDADAQWFGYGDAWDAWIDTDAITIKDLPGLDSGDSITNTDMGDTTVDVTQGEIYNSFVNLLGFTRPFNITGPITDIDGNGLPDVRGVDRFFADPNSKQNDAESLDLHPDPLFTFIALGPAEGGSEETTLDAITLEFPKTSADFVPRDDLRNLSFNKYSGLSIWRNRDDFDSLGQEDEHLPLSVEDNASDWLSDTRVRLELEDGENLPSPCEATNCPDPGQRSLIRKRGLEGGDVNPTFYVSALLDKTSNFPDSFVATVRLGDVQFSQGNSVADGDTLGSINQSNNMQPLRPTIQTHTNSETFAAQTVSLFYEQLTTNDQDIGAPSDPTPVIGLNALDHEDDGAPAARLSLIDIRFENGDTAFRASDLNDLSNTDRSGVAIYKDDNDDPKNKVGVFQANIDDRLPINTSLSTKSLSTGNASDAPQVRLKIDSGGTVPANDTGDSIGSDFFVVVRTSDQADNLDQFQAALGNPAIDDGIELRVEFARPTAAAPTVIFGKGDAAATDRFYSDLVNINTITGLAINSITGSNPKVSSNGERLELFGINVTDGNNGDQSLEQIRTTFNFNSSSDTSDIRALREDKASGVALYRNNGDGEFDMKTDEFISISNPNWKTYSGTATVNLTPDTNTSIPDINDSVDDFFVVMRASRTIDINDSFTVSIRGGDIRFSVEDSPENKSETTPVISASLPILLEKLTDSPRQSISDDNTPLAVMGINSSDGGGFDENFEGITVNLNDVNTSNFSITDLQDLSSDTTSGVAIWRDANGDGQFDETDDTFLTPDVDPTFSSGSINFSFTNNTTDDTSIPNTLDNKNDFFVVLKNSSTIQHADDFNVRIPAAGVETTLFESGSGLTTNTIVFGSANSKKPVISDTDLINDKLTVVVSIANQDTVALRMATDEDAADTPLSHLSYDVVQTSRPDKAGSRFYTFKNVPVSISVDTIGLAARGFNDTGPSKFSNRAYLTRDELVGIDLTGFGRPAGADLSKADAMAADQEFGIAVFGDKGPNSSNDNPSDPVFDPSSGETLKIIPPVDSTVTLEVYNMQQERVFRTTTSTPGQVAEWDGSGQFVSTVNNGVYIVKVKSGSEVKSFPVVVLK